MWVGYWLGGQVGSSPVLHGGALWVAGEQKEMLSQASLWHSGFYAAPSGTRWGRLTLLKNPHLHGRQAM